MNRLLIAAAIVTLGAAPSFAQSSTAPGQTTQQELNDARSPGGMSVGTDGSAATGTATGTGAVGTTTTTTEPGLGTAIVPGGYRGASSGETDNRANTSQGTVPRPAQ